MRLENQIGFMQQDVKKYEKTAKFIKTPNPISAQWKNTF